MDYPCIKCGICCKRVGNFVKKTGINFEYKYDESGRCEKLNEDNSCSVYDNRPIICDINRMGKELGYDEKEWFNININSCNKMFQEEGLNDFIELIK